MTRPIQNDESLSIELEEEDLLDIDGSDDPTMAFGGKGLLSKLRAPRKKANANRVQVAHVPDVVDDPTMIVRERDRDDVRETMPFPMRFASKSPSSPPAAHAPVPASIAPKSPTISPAPPVRLRSANSSYPPIAIHVGALRDRQMSFISERPSRAGWIAAAVIGALILLGGSIKVAAPKAQHAAEPTPVAAAEPPAPAADTTPEEAKVVTFGENQGVSIKAKPEAKADPKAETKKPAAHAAAKPAAKPAASSKVDSSLAASKDDASSSKASAASHDAAPAGAISKAEQKKLKSIEQDLADLQLKAAAR